MISVIIPTLNAGPTIGPALSALVPAAVDGVIRQVIVADGGSTDETREIADLSGADVVRAAPGRGRQLAEGAKIARFPWLLFLHGDTVLSEGWDREAMSFIRRVDEGDLPSGAAVFRFGVDDRGLAPRLLEALSLARCKAGGLPAGDQGLLISRRLFDHVGGYRDLPVMEDVDLARRIGRKRLALLEAKALTSASRYKKQGYVARSLRDQLCLALYRAGMPANRVAALYGSR